ncbi:MAG: phosphoribosylformylglycinamidine synthase subunit PurL [Deltaproteobacteria bacterium]|nr:phosphoribosylformylglycinamidine synthase subunit PurL [Deltaproteobacteria bacterium]
MKNTSINESVIEGHGLTLEEYKRIEKTLDRAPNMVELGIFAAMWSEHCSYKSSRVHLRRFPTKGPNVLQGPGENAGIIDIGDGLAVAFKIESHNHPSFIEPYQGAATGVGGILRDIFTMGARPVALLNSLRFGAPSNPKTKYLLEGVVSGIAGYGNCVGVPTVGGEVYFHESYDSNCLVNAMAVGILKKDRIFRGQASGRGNPVIYAGSRTGRDGIHGAVMASDVFGQGGEDKRPTVQVGDPFTEKLLLEACIEAFKKDCIIGIQDMGAAGLTSSSVEMASRGGSGIEIDISMVPRREGDMNGYEVMLSESQERMLIVVKEGSEEELMSIFRKWGLEAAVIGRVTADGKLRVLDNGRIEAEIPVGALTDSAPLYERPIKRPDWQDEATRLDMKDIALPQDYAGALIKLLSSLNIASKEWIYRQYDHMVRTDTVVCPGSDAAVVRIKGTKKALAMTVDCNSRYVYLDPFIGGMIAVAESARNLIASGARPIALTDCLNFGSPERPEIMWQFSEAICGMSKAAEKLGVPVISGNVSLYNETSGSAIYPTPTVGMVGLINDIKFNTTQWFKDEGDIIVLLGRTYEELGASEYLKVIYGMDKGMPPRIDLDVEKALHEACLSAINAGIIKSSHDVSEGGLASAIAECCMSGNVLKGAELTFDFGGMRPDAFLFGESQSRVILSLDEDNIGRLEDICASNDLPLCIIGRVGADMFRINDLMSISVERLKEVWSGTLENYVR